MRCEVLPDWLTFTIRGIQPHEVIRDVLGMDVALFKALPYSWKGYQDVVEFENIRIASNFREDEHFKNMGVCVSMSGNGCRNFETMSSLGGTAQEGGFSENFMKLFQYLDKRLGYEGEKTVNVTRLDMASDDRSGLLDRDTIIDFVIANKINSRCKVWNLILGSKCKVKNGFTVYIGSKKSDNFVKIYDKEAEMKQNKLLDTGHWIRVEHTLRDKYAESFIHALVIGKPVGELVSEVLNDKFQFINHDDSNITRCSVCDWWAEFVGEVKKVRLVARRAAQHTVSQLEQWVKDQIAPSLYILQQTIGYDDLRDIILSGEQRVMDDSKKLAVISHYHTVKWIEQREFERTEYCKALKQAKKEQEELRMERNKPENMEKRQSELRYRALRRQKVKKCVPAHSAEPIVSFGT